MPPIRLTALPAVALAFGFALAGCNNNPDQAENSDVADRQVIDLDRSGQQEDDAVSADNADQSSARGAQSPSGGTMIRGGSDTAGTRPPANSKLQRAD